jgi:hypothetical protein
MPRGAPASAPEFRKMTKVYPHNWMSALKPDRKLIDLWLPGSHDAGVYEDEERGVKPTPGPTTRCQEKNIHEQARNGSRVFDIRCWLKDGKPTMGHFAKDKASAVTGDWGGTLESALDDAVKFLNLNTKEFLIFRIGHTKCAAEVDEVVKAMDSGKLKYANFILKGSSGHFANLANLQVKNLQGKLLLIFDKEFLKLGDFKLADGYFPYVKHPEISADGLSFCGTYSGEFKTRLKGSKKDQGNWSAEGAEKVAMAASEEHRKNLTDHKSDHLFWVYWQETGGNVWENTKKGMHLKLDLFLSKFSVGNLPHPNIIGHDFVNTTTCGAIVKMNESFLNFQQDWVLDKYGYG